MDAILTAMRACALDPDAHVQCQAGAAIEQLTDQDETMRVCGRKRYGIVRVGERVRVRGRITLHAIVAVWSVFGVYNTCACVDMFDMIGMIEDDSSLLVMMIRTSVVIVHVRCVFRSFSCHL